MIYDFIDFVLEHTVVLLAILLLLTISSAFVFFISEEHKHENLPEVFTFERVKGPTLNDRIYIATDKEGNRQIIVCN